MAITRPELSIDRDFTIVRNAWARDGRLSLRARGLLVQLLSHRPGWTVTTESLMRDNPEGRDSIRGAVRELEGVGYLKRQRQRRGNRLGGVDYILQEPPASCDGFSGVGNLGVGPLGVEEPTDKEDYSKNTREKKTREASSSPGGDGGRYSPEFLEWWEHYPRKQDKGAAYRAFQKIRDTPLETLIEGADRYTQDPNREPRFTKHAATWLRARAWEDETPLPARNTKPTSRDRLAQIQALKGGDQWTEQTSLTS